MFVEFAFFDAVFNFFGCLCFYKGFFAGCNVAIPNPKSTEVVTFSNAGKVWFIMFGRLLFSKYNLKWTKAVVIYQWFFALIPYVNAVS